MQNPTAHTLLSNAANCINGERAGDYGAAVDNFERIAALWTAMTPPTPDGSHVVFTVEDVANFMICVKLARLVNTPGHMDSLVDICGYAALARQTHEDMQAREKDRPWWADLVDRVEDGETLESVLAADGFPDPDYDEYMGFDDDDPNYAFDREDYEEFEAEEDEPEVDPVAFILSVWSHDELNKMVGDMVLGLSFESSQFNSGLSAYTSMLRHLRYAAVSDIESEIDRVRLGAYLQAATQNSDLTWAEIDHIIDDVLGDED